MVVNLITGIGGFVASHLADLLLEKGETVVGTHRWNEDLSRIKHIKDRIIMVPADLNDLSSLISAVQDYKPDYIFHLAAQSYVSDSYNYPVETININTLGTVNLLEAVRIVRGYNDRDVNSEAPFDPVIHVCSSSEVYGLVEEKDIPIKETCRFNPSNPYAVGKVGADMAALLYFTNYGLKVIRTRMFTHTGPRRTMMSAECAFAKQIATFEKMEKEINKMEFDNLKVGKTTYMLQHGNLNSVRTWADVRDAVKAYYLLVREGVPGEVYNIGGDTTKTIGEMLDYLMSLSDISIEKQVDKSLLRPYDVTLQVPDCTKFKKLGWKPEITFEKTMEDMLNWWRENI